jgi:sugar-specific transcriptional regulator TrmB
MTTMAISENLVKELTCFGLTGNEAKVYLTLLQLGKAGARAIAKLSNVPRQEIYRVLPQLERVGIVEVIIDKPTQFLAINPETVLSVLIDRQHETLSKQISELRQKKLMLENELRKVEGKSAGVAKPKPVHFALISGPHQISEKIDNMLRSANVEVLWMVPKTEILRAVIYDRDEMLRKCARRNVRVRIVTEVDHKNVKEVKKLSNFCEIRHSPEVTSLMTIVDDRELIVGSAVHTIESSPSDETMHELWTNDSGHINAMKDFFEKVWNASIPANLRIEPMQEGDKFEKLALVRGTDKVRKRVLDLLSQTKSNLFMVSRVDDASISLVESQIEIMQKANISIRWITTVDKQNAKTVQKLSTKISLRSVKERPVSFVVTDTACIFSSSPVLQIPNEVVWSADPNTVNMFKALAEELWSSLSKNITAD